MGTKRGFHLNPKFIVAKETPIFIIEFPRMTFEMHAKYFGYMSEARWLAWPYNIKSVL